MRKVLFLSLFVCLLSSCGTTDSLYYWGGTGLLSETTRYEELAYRYFGNHTPESICNLISLYEDMVTKPSGERQVPPPGICAEYAYLISQPEVVNIFINNATYSQKGKYKTDDLVSYFPIRAKALYEMELSLYPESATFIKPLYDKIVNK